MDNKKAGFAAIIGRPNVGKSTLLNAIIGERLAAVSPKPQTTRTSIMAILNRGPVQLVFIDTPGFHQARSRLGEYMVKQVSDSIGDVDCAIFVVEPKAEPNAAELAILDKLIERKLPCVLAINKIDTVQKETVLPVIASYMKRYPFVAIVPVSAAKKEGIDALLEETSKLIPEGPWLFPDDMLTDQPERQIASEIIREKLLTHLSDEVPHGTAVDIEKMSERDGANETILDIEATIYCEKMSHKGIIIGKKGEMLKKIATAARFELERFFEIKINLQLWVKVRDDWRNNPRELKRFGFK